MLSVFLNTKAIGRYFISTKSMKNITTCGVMRAAATHTTTKPSSREQFCSAGCRQQTAVRRGQSVGQLRHHEEEENLEKDLKNFPIVITRSGLGNSRHQDPRSWTSRPSFNVLI